MNLDFFFIIMIVLFLFSLLPRGNGAGQPLSSPVGVQLPHHEINDLIFAERDERLYFFFSLSLSHRHS